MDNNLFVLNNYCYNHGLCINTAELSPAVLLAAKALVGPFRPPVFMFLKSLII